MDSDRSRVILEGFPERSKRFCLEERADIVQVEPLEPSARERGSSGLYGEKHCGLAPFKGNKHSVAMYVVGDDLILRMDAHRFVLSDPSVRTTLEESRRYWVPVRTFVVKAGSKEIFKCKYFYRDTYRGGWPDNDDILFVVASASKDQKALRRTVYVWQCSQRREQPDLKQLAEIESG